MMWEPEALVPRRLELDGLVNARDLGGLPAGSCLRVRAGLVYRSDALARLTRAGFDQLQRLNVRTVLDLRTSSEREREPSPVRSTVIDLQGRFDVREWYAKGIEGDELLLAFYRSILRDSAASIGAAVRVLGDASRRPVLIHCTAGKDRTGVVVAVLLSVLGVHHASILEDYALSSMESDSRHRREALERAIALGAPAASAAAVLGAPEHVLATALSEIVGQHGAAERYLIDRCGVPRPVIEQLRRELLEA